MGDPIRNQNLQTNLPTAPSQEPASTSSATGTDRSGGAPVTQTETTQAFHHLGQGSWAPAPESVGRKRKRSTETAGRNPMELLSGKTVGKTYQPPARQPAEPGRAMQTRRITVHDASGALSQEFASISAGHDHNVLGVFVHHEQRK